MRPLGAAPGEEGYRYSIGGMQRRLVMLGYLDRSDVTGTLDYLPYGPRPLDELRRFAAEIAGYLQHQGVKLIVAACNSASAAALPDLQRQLGAPVRDTG